MAHDSLAPVRALYSMTQVLEMEHLIDETIDILCEKLDRRFVETGAKCDITDYVLYGESNRTRQVILAKY